MLLSADLAERSNLCKWARTDRIHIIIRTFGMKIGEMRRGRHMSQRQSVESWRPRDDYNEKKLVNHISPLLSQRVSNIYILCGHNEECMAIGVKGITAIAWLRYSVSAVRIILKRPKVWKLNNSIKSDCWPCTARSPPKGAAQFAHSENDELVCFFAPCVSPFVQKT